MLGRDGTNAFGRRDFLFRVALGVQLPQRLEVDARNLAEEPMAGRLVELLPTGEHVFLTVRPQPIEEVTGRGVHAELRSRKERTTEAQRHREEKGREENRDC
jgi:hypothetical protein